MHRWNALIEGPGREIQMGRAVEREEYLNRIEFGKRLYLEGRTEDAALVLLDCTSMEGIESDPDLIGQAELQLGYVRGRQGNKPESRKHFLNAEKISERCQDAQFIRNVLLMKARCHFDDGEPEMAAKTASHGLELAREARSRFDEAGFLGSLGEFSMNMGVYSIAEKALEEARSINDSINNISGLIYILNQLGVLYMRKGELLRSIGCREKARDLGIKENRQLDLGFTLLGLGESMTMKCDFEIAGKYLQDALKIFKDKENPAGTISSLIAVADLMKRQGKYQEMSDVLSTALESAEEIDETRLLAQCHNFNADVELTRGEREMAKKDYYISLTLSERVKENRVMARNLSSLASLYYDEGNFKKSLSFLMEAVMICNEVHDQISEIEPFLELSNAYGGIGDLEQSKSYAVRAFIRAENSGMRDVLTLAFCALGRVQSREKMHDQAMMYFNEALILSRKLGQGPLELVVVENLAYEYSRRDEFDRASDFYRQARTLALKSKNEATMANALLSGGLISFRRGEYDMAEKILLEGEAIAAPKRLGRLLCPVYFYLGRVAEGQGNPAKALGFYEKGCQVGDRIVRNIPDRLVETFMNVPGRRDIYSNRDRLRAETAA